MHPMLHMSTAFWYRYEPRRISGARYHLVATYSVSTGNAMIFYDDATVILGGVNGAGQPEVC
jgi:hypothetical protein